MQVKLNYKPSEALLKSHLIATGNRLSERFLSVDLATLTPEQRAAIVRCGISYKDDADLPELATGIDANHYNGPRLETKSAPEWDTIPTADEWIAEAQRQFATRDQFKPELDAIIAAKRQAKEAHDKRLAEVQTQYKALQAEWLPRIQAMSEDDANQPLPEAVRDVESELRTLLGGGRIGWNELSVEKSNRWKELHDERVKAEAHAVKAAWIAEYGSDHLKRAWTRDHDCQRKYVIERARLEAPAFTVDFEDNAEWKPRACPSVEALDQADAVEAHKLGSVEIVWLTEPAQAVKPSHDDYDYEEPFEACEAIVIRGYLGKYDLVKEL